MLYEFNLPNKDVLPITLYISNMSINLKPLFNLGAVKVYENSLKNDDYRTAFAKMVYFMYEKTDSDNPPPLSEDDFIHTSDENLEKVMNGILLDNKELNDYFNREMCDSPYEKFASAHANNSNNSKLIMKLFIFPSLFEQSKLINPLKKKSPLQKINTSISSTFDKFRKPFKLSETLKSFDWLCVNTLPQNIVDKISQNKDILSKDDVDNMITSYYHKDNYENLKQIVNQWSKSDLSYILKRQAVFQEAFANHTRGCYLSSFTLLFLHMEGIMTDFIQNTLQVYEKFNIPIFNTIIQESRSSPLMYAIAVDSLIKTFHKGYDPGFADLVSIYSRNRIAHGQVYNGVKETDSLKAFLNMNELQNYLPSLKTEILNNPEYFKQKIKLPIQKRNKKSK